MKKYFLFSLIILSTVLAVPAYAEVSVNSGFIPGQIWYSKAVLVEGDTVNIHTAIWNGEKNSLSVKVEFYDKNVILGSRDVTLAVSELKDIYIPWKITSGDHVISAKIISSLATISGKSEKVVLVRTVTSNDKQSVSVVVKDSSGKVVSGDRELQTQIDKTTSEINNIIPKKVSTTVTNGFNIVDDLRDKILTEVTTIKNDTKKEIAQMENKDKTTIEVSSGGVNVKNGTDKPIAYIKLFLFSFLAFVLGNKIVFYGVLIFIVFVIFRSIYRMIRNR